jgi:uncharacterized protein involved in outer membrane biogenesis
MNESPSSVPRSGRRRGWLRIIVRLSVVLIVLLVVAWFVVTSSTFFKGFILPRVSKAANATVTVDEAVISPFSHVILRNLKVRTTGAEPLVTAAEIRIRYHLMDFLGGNLNVDEVALVSPVINLVRNPDGTSNLDPLLKSQSQETKTGSPVKNSNSKISKRLHVYLKELALTDATFLETKNYGDGRQDVTEISHVNVTLDDVKNGGSGKLDLSADVNIDNQPPPPAASGNLQAKVAGHFTFTLAADLMPLSIQGNTHLGVTQAGGAMQDFAAFGADLDCDVTSTEITQIALRFQKSVAQLGELRVNGPFDMEKTEGRLNVGILGVDRRVLNLFGAAGGIDFGGTAINSTNQIELAKSGSVITATGRFTIDGLQVTRASQTTPLLDAHADYNVTVDCTAQTALLNTLTLTATQNRNPLAHAELSSPLGICWGNAAAGGDSTLSVTVTGLNLADWQPLLGGAVLGGGIDFNAKLAAQSGGKQFAFDLGSQITSLAANFSGNRISQAGIDLRVRGQVADFKQFKLDECRLQVTLENQPLLTVSGSGTCDPATQNADMQVQLQAALPGLLELLPQADANLSSGAVEVTGSLTQKGQTQIVGGTLALTALTGHVGKNKFHNFGVTAGLDATKNAEQIQISRLAGQLTGDGIAGGNFQTSGNCDLDKKSGQLTAKLADFNENGLRPFLEPLLAGKKLLSIAINADADAQFDLQNDAAVKADLQVTNLVVGDSTGQLPSTPLQAEVQIDAACHKQVADLRQLQITLTPTARADNVLLFTGSVDFSQTNAIAGNLKLAANALDVTSYYELFNGQSKSKPVGASPPPPAATGTVAANTNQEPAAVYLPFGDFTLDAAIGRFYLDEVDVSNLQATVKINGSRVSLAPFQLFLNGAPVNATADLNLGVPGYQYDVSANADRIPIAPLADSFSPSYKDKAEGDLLANIQVKGAGITGVNLQTNLAGDVALAITNADVQLVGPKAKAFIATIARVAELAGVSGMGNLTNSTLNRLDVQLRMGDGKIALTRCLVLVGAFRIITTGEIPIAPVLDDSPFNDWPIHIAIGHGSAENADAFSDDGYHKLPTFVTLGGTLGDPKIGSPIFKAGVGAVTNATSRIKAWLQKHTSNSGNTEGNQSGTNAPPTHHLFDFFK